MFLLWEGFINRLTQIYRDLEVIAMAKYTLQKLIQRGLVIKYTI
jgi:hypothetical protein